MDLLDQILNGDNGKAVKEISKEYGLSEEQTKETITNLVPVFQRSMQHKDESGELGSLVELMEQQNEYNLTHEPQKAMDRKGIEQGNEILGTLFGSKEVSRSVASHFSARSGVQLMILKKLLPVVANLVLSAVIKSRVRKGAKSSKVLKALDLDGDSKVIDGLLNMVGKILR